MGPGEAGGGGGGATGGGGGAPRLPAPSRHLASRAPLEPPEQALRPEETDQEVRRKDEGVLEGRRQVHHGDALDHADEERREERAEDATEAAERDDGVRQHGELQ